MTVYPTILIRVLRGAAENRSAGGVGRRAKRAPDTGDGLLRQPEEGLVELQGGTPLAGGGLRPLRRVRLPLLPAPHRPPGRQRPFCPMPGGSGTMGHGKKHAPLPCRCFHREPPAGVVAVSQGTLLPRCGKIPRTGQRLPLLCRTGGAAGGKLPCRAVSGAGGGMGRFPQRTPDAGPGAGKDPPEGLVDMQPGTQLASGGIIQNLPRGWLSGVQRKAGVRRRDGPENAAPSAGKGMGFCQKRRSHAGAGVSGVQPPGLVAV